MPESRDQGCSVIGKFTQGSKADGKRLTRRLVTDRGELDYLVRDTRLSGTLVGAPMKCELGQSSPTTMALNTVRPFEASMLAYAHINLLSMLLRFEPDEAVRVATDSIYVMKTALSKLEGVGAYKPHEVHPKGYCRICLTCHDKATQRPPRDGIAPAQWREKGESFFMPMEHAAYLAKPEYKTTKEDLTPSTAPRLDDPLTRHQLSYLNVCEGSGKTTRAIEIFHTRNPLVWPKRCGPGASRPRPITASSAGAAKPTGRPRGWDRNSFPV